LTPAKRAPATGRRPAGAGRKAGSPGPPAEFALSAQLRQPGTVLGPRASRTITAILDAARQTFLTRGYAGTIDEIARAAGISRASFYTYFPSKRDVLLALGADTLDAARQRVKALAKLPADWDLADLEDWVGDYLGMLEEHGSFVFAWTQAAHEDEAIRRAGMKGHLAVCRQMGRALASLGDRPAADPAEAGLLAFSMLERGWAYWRLYEGTVKKATLQRSMARMLAATAGEGRVRPGRSAAEP
jgi:AcrR family transcriptional regulator